MAASCISVSASAVGSLVAARSAEASSTRQAARLTFGSPSISTGGCSLDVSATSMFSFGSRSVRNSGIIARAADLEEAPAAVAASTKLYVGNLPWSIHSKELAEIFQGIGNVELVEVIYDRDTQKSRGFAFVTMSTSEEAQKAIDSLDNSELDGRVIRVSFPQTRESRPRDGFKSDRAPRERREYSPRGGGSADTENKLFVGNLSWGIDDGALYELFSEHGTVAEARVVTDRDTGRSRGFGFVKYSSEAEAKQAQNALDGSDYDGRTLKVNPAGDKPERRDGPRY